MLAYNTCNFPYFRYNYLPCWLRSDHYLNGLYISKLDFEFQMIGFCTNHFFNQWLEWSDVAIEFVFQLQNFNYKFHYRLSFIPHEVFTSRDILIVWSLWGHINACNFLPILVYVIILSFSLRKWDLWMWWSYQSFYFWIQLDRMKGSSCYSNCMDVILWWCLTTSLVSYSWRKSWKCFCITHYRKCFTPQAI